MREDYNIELNGYSNFIVEKASDLDTENFTVTISCIPYTYETTISGIVSAFSECEKKGIAIGVMKRGIVTVKIGLGGQIVEIESLKENLKFQKKNVITIAFWGTAGWCDLSINGILSNRIQFKRHSKVMIPAGFFYVGKYVDGNHYLPESRFGVFHGKLEYIEAVNGYLNDEEVMKIHREQTQNEVCKINLYAEQDFSSDVYRPVYHLMPPGKWMNEPHAPFWYHGFYHIFYQANPHAPVWDNLCWGHLVSKDMVRWLDAGIALYPDEESIDPDGCWSGSACQDSDGTPVLFYTAGRNRDLPNQSVAVAYPANPEDHELRKWIKGGVVLRQGMREGFFGEFRDPFVWRKEDVYYILIGTGGPDNGGGNAILYTSKDLKEFACHGLFIEYDYGKCEEAGHVWELPVVLPLKKENGEYCCDIFLFCACQIEKEAVETYYFLGKTDYENKRFRKFHEQPRLIDLGHGTFTGASGFVTPDERSVFFTIAQGKREPAEEYASGWAHNGGLPVQLSVKDNALSVSPIDEIKKYFSRCVLLKTLVQEHSEKPVFLTGDLLENRIMLHGKGSFLELILEWETDTYVISYSRKTQEWKAVSGKTGRRISIIRGEDDLVDIGGEEIEMECYIDHSMIEIYLNHKKGMTLRSYDFCEKNKCFVRTDGGCEVSVWEYVQ